MAQVFAQHSSRVTPTWSTLRSSTTQPSPQFMRAQRGSQHRASESPTQKDRSSDAFHNTPHLWAAQVCAQQDS
eukprot:CAMPEP_0181442796 /NCGR_PEP_ID=MMETSP1110-20121109/24215_1 /TAXON_ID=174948 /ORGANISM="Symbiodinium sp., Strain CCMP421" /LENGTH=72 /DNA_ID=CAMNT_0023566737 /DNA_START=673 /DNA_END=891 /DNA_ORIENTATION=+